MMGIRLVAVMFLVSFPACAAVRSGSATAEWISASTTFAPGKELQTAICLVVDDGWHTYWLNPGEGGMKTSAEWELPEGWSVSGLDYPVPERFRSAGLTGFGYTGVVVLPVTVTPPADFHDGVKLKLRLSWLTCDENTCVPGDVELSLDLKSGSPAPTAHGKTIREALRRIPRPQQEWIRLNVTEKEASLVLTIDADGKRKLDMSRCAVFPATLNSIDPAADIRFIRNGEQWKAEVPRSRYAESPLKRLTLVIAGIGVGEPVELTWQAP